MANPKLKLRNLADDVISFLQNSATSPRQWSLQNRDGTLADDTDINGRQPLDSDITAIAAISPANDDFIQRKSGVWVNRTPSQVKFDLIENHYRTGEKYSNNIDAGGPISVAIGANTLRAFPWRPKATLVCDYMDIAVSIAAGSSSFRMAFYDDNGSGFPGAKIAFSDVDGGTFTYDSTATGVKNSGTLGTKFTLLPTKRYWFSVLSNGSIGWRSWVATQIENLGGDLVVSVAFPEYTCWEGPFTYAAMPSNFPTTSFARAAFGCPSVFLRHTP